MGLSKERILITGAAGFVGACLARRLVQLGCRPHVILQDGSDLWRIRDIMDKLTMHIGDLTDAAGVKRLVQKSRPTIIYHLAAHGAYPSQTDAARMMAVNVTGTLHLLTALSKVDYKLFLNTGSSSEYGFKTAAMKEPDVLVPNSFYATAKAAQTLLCQYIATSQKRPIVTFRLFSVYGPYEEPSRLVPTIINRCLNGQDLRMAGPQTARDFIYVGDVIEAYLNTAPLLKAGGEIFNIGRGEQSTLKQVTGHVLGLTGARVKVNWGGMPARCWDAPRWVADVAKAKHVLGFRATTSLREGLGKTIEWTKQEG